MSDEPRRDPYRQRNPRNRPNGTGSLVERDGRWHASILLSGGKHVRRVRRTQEEGEAALQEMIAKHIHELGWFYQQEATGRRAWWPKKPNRPRSGVTIRRRWEVLERDGHRCVYCGNTPNEARLVVDHVIAVANGGTDDMDNLVTACVPCNAGKSSKRLRVVG